MATVQKPFLQRVTALPPFLFDQDIHESLADTPDIPMDTSYPKPSWTYAKKSRDGNRLPQTIAHRGYKAKHPENTMGAFRGAVKAGTHAIETDIHLTKDGVVVLSHASTRTHSHASLTTNGNRQDATMKRCFGRDEKIIDCTWDQISKLRTLQEPHEPMPRLVDLLQFLASPGTEDIWVLLDIKLDNDADAIMRLIAAAIHSVPASSTRPWNQRILLGCWALKYLPLCTTHLPTFPIAHIGFSLSYARRFLTHPSISFNMLQKVLMGPFGAKFLRDARAAHRALYVWTVNDDAMMRWSISRDVDGVITDDPKRFLEVCEEWEAGRREVKVGWRVWAQVAWIWVLVCVFGAVFWWRYGGEGGRRVGGKEGGEEGVDAVRERGRVVGGEERAGMGEEEEEYRE